MKYELTISTSYVEDWGIWEGVREILQNAKDEEDKNSHQMTVEYNEQKRVLKIKNDGAFLERRVMLTGYSDKRNDKSLRGMYGEGLKLGTIALLRRDIGVKIRNCDELWVPSFIRSPKYNNEQILSFNVSKQKDCGAVIVEITGLREDDWEDIKSKVLFLNKDIKCTKTDHGYILEDEQYQGKIFVKDMFVSLQKDYRYGYNLTDIATDRDRKMVGSFLLNWELADMWSQASCEDDETLEEVYDMFTSDTNDVGGFKDNYPPWDFKEKICDRFVSIHGRDAFPVKTQEEADDMSHLGKKGVVVPAAFGKVLEYKFNEKTKESLKSGIKKIYEENDLSAQARENLLWVRGLISKVGYDDKNLLKLVDPWIKIVDFCNPDVLGQFRLTEKKIFISRRAVLSKKELLNSIVEEIAHMTLKSHGHYDFKKALHDIYSLIILNSEI